MTPTDAAAIAADLHAILAQLIALDLHPILNASRIEVLRREALSCSTLLSGYLHCSENFLPVEDLTA